MREEKKRINTWLMLGAIGLVALVGAGVAWQQAQRDLAPVSGMQAWASLGGPIHLMSAQGEFRLSDVSMGEAASVGAAPVVALYFGYTQCPDVCPMTLAALRQVMAELPPATAARVVPVMISLDPERDTPARLAEYTGHFGPRFIGVTGSDEELAEIARRYGVSYRRVEAPDSALGYTIDHGAALYLVSNEGRIYDRIPFTPGAAGIRAGLTRVLNETRE
ncbi:SCO family protein [Cobetia crustatorum]|uniref:SCO family protein n=1 Tax=Cobetia crustatorum TaxID=553385 RepID=A0A558HSC2_9GAMM|nr:SCO family protein [Cobetia crustatorum]TVU72030.1 SCO family protein [Cobetia crustatorum]